MQPPQETQGIVDRRFKFCRSFEGWKFSELVSCCIFCSAFSAKCCQHPSDECHHFRLVFIDGACSDNGKIGARAGIGLATGSIPAQQLSIAITDEVDAGGRRTSQRAELLAACLGLDFAVSQMASNHAGSNTHLDSSQEPQCCVLVSDSEYVVKGMTEWLPTWKKNNWRKPDKKYPGNLDLFQRLDAAVTEQERRGRKIGFLHVLREHNNIADKLAKKATINQS
ncbi:ribonuclease H-like domain-containing protein [Mycena rebaudengoi]|nr:ribonuclease H-like domain-containing protein [Mycena rebaudengoi]